MKSQAENLLEIDKGGEWSRIEGLCDFKGDFFADRTVQRHESIDVIILVFI